ncbi:MAG: DNA-formamidopyrimidine glycosylase [Patescibacteria group bacterium]|nr:DNA-formamidopyrimidine glycosylase [Patescibacteria group bacterium]
MPSLPELEVYKRQFTREIVGQPIARVEAVDLRVVRAETQALEGLLVGRAITSISRYGKWLVWDAGAPEQLITHLGLTGKLRLLTPGDELPKFACFVLHFADGRRLVMSDQRHLGKIYVREFIGLKAEKALGPDLLDIPEEYFVTTLRAKRRGVRDVLMDQKLIAGIGGKYADEFLWQARLNPHTKFSALSEAESARLHQLTRRLTDEAITLDADPERFPDDWLIPHRHTDQICPRCHGPLTAQGTAFHCPRCQPEPDAHS